MNKKALTNQDKFKNRLNFFQQLGDSQTQNKPQPTWKKNKPLPRKKYTPTSSKTTTQKETKTNNNLKRNYKTPTRGIQKQQAHQRSNYSSSQPRKFPKQILHTRKSLPRKKLIKPNQKTYYTPQNVKPQETTRKKAFNFPKPIKANSKLPRKINENTTLNKPTNKKLQNLNHLKPRPNLNFNRNTSINSYSRFLNLKKTDNSTSQSKTFNNSRSKSATHRKITRTFNSKTFHYPKKDEKYHSKTDFAIPEKKERTTQQILIGFEKNNIHNYNNNNKNIQNIKNKKEKEKEKEKLNMKKKKYLTKSYDLEHHTQDKRKLRASLNKKKLFFVKNQFVSKINPKQKKENQQGVERDRINVGQSKKSIQKQLTLRTKNNLPNSNATVNKDVNKKKKTKTKSKTKTKKTKTKKTKKKKKKQNFDEESIEDPYKERKITLVLKQKLSLPNERELMTIKKILLYPPIFKLRAREKNLIWYWRIFLSKNKWKGVLPTFIRSVDFDNEQEITEMKKLVPSFKELDAVDALELLSKHYKHPYIRELAVNRLKKCEDDVLQLYLLQIVQGLRYEENENSPLSTFLIERAFKNPILGNFFYWYVGNERNDNKFPIFARVHLQFAKILLKNEMGKHCLKVLHRQEDLVNNLKTLSKEANSYSKNRKKNKLYLSWLLENDQKYSNLKNFEKDVPLPLDPLKVVVGIDPKSVIIFKSALKPIKLSFITNLNKKYSIIFKKGDDLRQDQLVLQLFTIMDNLLKNENMDLELTIYDVISNSPEEGMVEFVKAKSLASVLKENNGKLAEYFKKTSPDKTSDFGFSNVVMNRYVRSCAGYSVLTYLLGIGDRHLDNLMISPSGRLIHIDFGYILGRDPKPFPPPMKVCKEMVEAMGGMKSDNYNYLKILCGHAYIILRRHARLIINLLSLMIDANIPDIDHDPKGAILKMQEKFRLELSEEEAIEFIQKKLDESVGALFAVVVEKLHSWAQYCNYFS
ncbi:phosphatidylinositol 3-kinase catalytic subunit type 3 [Anaeramoeba flamelloides]|uniref:Phosphatidylinositol 3-kinase catalytic subunit type 3 n=1 Tax=Anaeramoeba flamelloides TaxID=1746091 RepID=A0ABQ8YHF2_9EUKA|nr:phosphatidylinositol 3-kinase catalytic subunit type 3 [Anaeramoeba flamelloides]